MCREAMSRMPNSEDHIEWLNEAPGEEALYGIKVQHERYASRELLSAFKCPTIPPFYLRIYVDKHFSRSAWVIVDQEKFAFLFE